MTEKLYDADSHLCEFTARVTECKECDGGYAVILDRTAFFPVLRQLDKKGTAHYNISVANKTIY